MTGLPRVDSASLMLSPFCVTGGCCPFRRRKFLRCVSGFFRSCSSVKVSRDGMLFGPSRDIRGGSRRRRVNPDSKQLRTTIVGMRSGRSASRRQVGTSALPPGRRTESFRLSMSPSEGRMGRNSGARSPQFIYRGRGIYESASTWRIPDEGASWTHRNSCGTRYSGHFYSFLAIVRYGKRGGSLPAPTSGISEPTSTSLSIWNRNFYVYDPTNGPISQGDMKDY